MMDVAVVTSVGMGNISLFISTQQTPAVFLRLYTGIHDQAIDDNYEGSLDQKGTEIPQNSNCSR